MYTRGKDWDGRHDGGRTLKAAIAGRLVKIQSSNHELIRLLGVIPFTTGEYPARDAEARERKLHEDFRDQCLFEPGMCGSEWFRASPELIARIREVTTKPSELGLPETFSAAR